MARLARGARYSGVAIVLHWTIALLVIVNLIVGLGQESIPALRAWMPGHKAIGILVLTLTLVRIAWRLGRRPPALPARTPAWERALAHTTHFALYALLLAMPLTGWLMVSGSAKRRPLDFFGVFDIPYLPVGPATGEIGAQGHGLLGWLTLALVALHIAAALRHHFVLRDTILARMSPWLAR